MNRLAFLVPPLMLLASACGGDLTDGFTSDPATPTHEPGNGTVPESRPEGPPPGSQSNQVASNVMINGYAISGATLAELEATYGLYVEDGDYWYDPYSGAWGFWGGPTEGFIMPYMNLGEAPLDASGGGTGVAVNGRELHPVDLASLQQLLGPIYPGYYWLDANGNYGQEGGPALGNLIYIAQGAGGQGGGYFDSTYFGNIGSDGQSSYFYDSSTGCSVMADGVSC